jgi:hypothetical protein
LLREATSVTPSSFVPSVDRTRAALACGFALVIALGCSRRHEEPPEAPVASRPAAPIAVKPPPTPPPQPPPPFVDPPSWHKPVPSDPSDDPARALLEQQESEAKKPRDFSAELQRMMGGASTCLQPRPRENSSAISVTFTAHVMPSGTVSRGEISASGLQDEERACLRKYLEGAQFGPPIENAPFSVMTTLSVSPKVAAATKQDTPKTDSLGMIITQAPSGEGVTPGIVPKEDPGVVPPGTPGVAIQIDPGVVPAPDPPAEVLPAPEPVQR